MQEKQSIKSQIQNIFYPNGTPEECGCGVRADNDRSNITFRMQLEQQNYWDGYTEATWNKFVILCKSILEEGYILDCNDAYELLRMDFAYRINKDCDPQLLNQLNELHFNYFSQQIDNINMDVFNSLFLTKSDTEHIFNNSRTSYKFKYLLIEQAMVYSATIVFCPFLSNQNTDILINKCLDAFEKLANYKADEKESIDKNVARHLAQLAESVIVYRSNILATRCYSTTYDRCCNIILKYIHTMYDDNFVKYLYDTKLTVSKFPKNQKEYNKYNSVNYFARYLRNFKKDTFVHLQKQYYNNLLNMIDTIQNVQKPIEKRESTAEQFFEYAEDNIFYSLYMSDTKRNEICCLFLNALQNQHSEKIKTVSLKFAHGIMSYGNFFSAQEEDYLASKITPNDKYLLDTFQFNINSHNALWRISGDDIYDLCCLTFIRYSYLCFEDLAGSDTYIPCHRHSNSNFYSYMEKSETQRKIQTYLFNTISEQIAKLDKNPKLECKLITNIQHYGITRIEECSKLSNESKYTLIKQCLDVLNRHNETKKYAVSLARGICSCNTYSKFYGDEIIKSCENIILNDKLSQQNNAQQELANETLQQTHNECITVVLHGNY